METGKYGNHIHRFPPLLTVYQAVCQSLVTSLSLSLLDRLSLYQAASVALCQAASLATCLSLQQVVGLLLEDLKDAVVSVCPGGARQHVALGELLWGQGPATFDLQDSVDEAQAVGVAVMSDRVKAADRQVRGETGRETDI